MARKLKNRKLNRCPEFDYSAEGFYFVTICTKDREECFGKVGNGKIILNEYGRIALKYWRKIPSCYLGVDIDKFIIMPNHIHGIIIIKDNRYVETEHVGTEYYSVPTKNYGLISKIVKSFKHAVTKEIRNKFKDNNFRWQRSFHDHVIGDGRDEYENIRWYIYNNPLQWAEDRNNL